jgi:hypothetical protein
LSASSRVSVFLPDSIGWSSRRTTPVADASGSSNERLDPGSPRYAMREVLPETNPPTRYRMGTGAVTRCPERGDRIVKVGCDEAGDMLDSVGETVAAGELPIALPPHAAPMRINSNAPVVTRGNVGREKRFRRLSMLARSLDGVRDGVGSRLPHQWGRAADISVAFPNPANPCLARDDPVSRIDHTAVRPGATVCQIVAGDSVHRV